MRNVISIGGLGGSGTRVVAEILMESGIYFGNIINNSNDNLIFKTLFKNPVWYHNSNAKEKIERFGLFERLMLNKDVSSKDVLMFKELVETNPFSKGKSNLLKRFEKYEVPSTNKWAWKNPNALLYLEPMFSYFKGRVAYVHVLRHGLDMAFSSNNQQLINWGDLYDIKLDSLEPNEVARAQFEYWLKTTLFVIKLKETMFPNQIHILNFNNLIDQNNKEIDSLFDFLNIHKTQKNFDFIENKRSNGRYKKEDLTIFSEADIQLLIGLGFKYDK